MAGSGVGLRFGLGGCRGVACRDGWGLVGCWVVGLCLSFIVRFFFSDFCSVFSFQFFVFCVSFFFDFFFLIYELC